MTCPCPNFTHRQGKNCECSRKASRAALGLHTEDGGHSVNGGISFPLETDPPVVTPEEAGAWSVLAQITLLAVVVGVLALAFIKLVLPGYPH